MLQPGAPVYIEATNFTRCKAWQLGGALCTETDKQTKDEEHLRDLDQTTALRVDAVFDDNNGNGRNLYVGPYFNLTDLHGRYWFTDADEGRIWNRRRCEMGECWGGGCMLVTRYRTLLWTIKQVRKADRCRDVLSQDILGRQLS